MDRTTVRTVALLIMAALVCIAGGVSAQAGAYAEKFSLEAYGDVLYSHYDYAADQKSGDHGSPADSRALVDMPFFVTELKYLFAPGFYVEAEVEYEHGGTGSALELEYEEFGEYETEVEKGGEVQIEEFHLTRSFGRRLNVRAGRFPVAIGLVNPSHTPTDFFTTVRAESETSVIPTTWTETGLEVFGALARVAYRVQLVNGLDSSGFSSKYWVVGGHQSKFEVTRATDMAVAARVDWEVVDGVVAGTSVYYGNTTQNRPKTDMEGIDAYLTVTDVHAMVERGPLRGRAMYLAGFLDNADAISAKNSRLSTNLQVSRTPVARGAFAWNAEIGYDVLSLFSHSYTTRLYPFVRYERYDTMADVDPGTFADPRFDRTVFTAGFNFFPDDDVVVKIDASHRTFGADRLNAENTVTLDVAFSADLIEL